MPTERKRAVVIGGGPAGLAAAYRLSRAGMDVQVVETDHVLGGLARSFELDGLQIERYYHFICGDDLRYLSTLDELGLRHRLRWKKTRMAFFHLGTLYPFSSAADLLRCGALSFIGRLRYALFVMLCTLRTDWARLDRHPAEPWIRRYLGERTYRATWYPLLNIKFHHHHPQISAAWTWHRVHRVARSRPTPLHAERLGYVDGGTQVLVDAFVDAGRNSGVQYRTSTSAAEIEVAESRVTGVRLESGERIEADIVISAVPLPVFLRLTPQLPPSFRRPLESIEFLGVVCVVLRLRQPVGESFWVNVNDPEIAFNGFIEYSCLNREATPDGSSIVYVPYYLPRGHERFRWEDARLIEEAVASLARINPAIRPESVMSAAVSRDPFAQVVCPSGFSGLMPPHETPVEGLYLVESSQLFPADRTISGTLELAWKASSLALARAMA